MSPGGRALWWGRRHQLRGGPMPGGGTSGSAWPDTGTLDAVVTSGAARLAVDLRGGGLRALSVGGWEVLDGYPAGAVPHGRRGGVLLPWPNRLRDGQWRWDGADLQLDVT